jgi:hypothetical protein
VLPIALIALSAAAQQVREADGTYWQRIDDSVANDYSVNCTEGVQPVYYYSPVRDVDLHTSAGRVVEIVFRRDSSEVSLSDRFSVTLGADVTCKIGRADPAR